MTTWRTEIAEALIGNKETWDDVESSTLTPAQLDREFNAGYGGIEGDGFTVWTKDYVYFPVCYDGAEWVGFVSRNPNGIATPHWGGG